MFDNELEKIPENLAVGSWDPEGADPVLGSRVCDYLFLQHPSKADPVSLPEFRLLPELNLLSLIYPKKKAKLARSDKVGTGVQRERGQGQMVAGGG